MTFFKRTLGLLALQLSAASPAFAVNWCECLGIRCELDRSEILAGIGIQTTNDLLIQLVTSPPSFLPPALATIANTCLTAANAPGVTPQAAAQALAQARAAARVETGGLNSIGLLSTQLRRSARLPASGARFVRACQPGGYLQLAPNSLVEAQDQVRRSLRHVRGLEVPSLMRLASRPAAVFNLASSSEGGFRETQTSLDDGTVLIPVALLRSDCTTSASRPIAPAPPEPVPASCPAPPSGFDMGNGLLNNISNDRRTLHIPPGLSGDEARAWGRVESTLREICNHSTQNFLNHDGHNSGPTSYYISPEEGVPNNDCEVATQAANQQSVFAQRYSEMVGRPPSQNFQALTALHAMSGMGMAVPPQHIRQLEDGALSDTRTVCRAEGESICNTYIRGMLMITSGRTEESIRADLGLPAAIPTTRPTPIPTQSSYHAL